jgi:hypothetical protein
MGLLLLYFYGSGAIILPVLAACKRVAPTHLSRSRARDGAAGGEFCRENDTELQHFATISGE